MALQIVPPDLTETRARRSRHSSEAPGVERDWTGESANEDAISYADRPRARRGLTKRFGTELRFDEVMRRAVKNSHRSQAAKRRNAPRRREDEKTQELIKPFSNPAKLFLSLFDPLQTRPQVFEKFRELGTQAHSAFPAVPLCGLVPLT